MRRFGSGKMEARLGKCHFDKLNYGWFYIKGRPKESLISFRAIPLAFSFQGLSSERRKTEISTIFEYLLLEV